MIVCQIFKYLNPLRAILEYLGIRKQLGCSGYGLFLSRTTILSKPGARYWLSETLALGRLCDQFITAV